MELQARDLEILSTVGELGTADTQMIRTQHFPGDTTGRACQQRLRMIAEEGLLKRVRLIAIDEDKTSGSLPTLWFLTEEGARLVERETGVRPVRVTHSDPKPFTLRHRREAVRARLAIDEGARLSGTPAPQWIMEQDTRTGIKRAKHRSPSDYLIFNQTYDRQGRTVSFRPDASFHLEIARPSGQGNKSLLGYLELDRSTEGHRQWQRKLWGIEAFLAPENGWSAHWPYVVEPTVRIFVLCKSRQRLSNLAETTASSPAAPLVRLATYPLDPQTVLTEKVWQDCNGRLLRIIAGA